MDLESVKVAPLEATLQQVARVLNHHSFSQSRGPARLLMHLAEQLATKGGCPATQADLARVLGLPEDFDPTRNPLVRMHMSKLRRKLERYRSGDGRHDAVALDIPRNSYRLQGYARDPSLAEELSSGPSAAGPVAAAAEAHGPGDDRTLVLVSEFNCEEVAGSGGTGSGSSGAAGGYTRSIAFWLVAELVETPWIAAVGPVLRERIGSDELTIDSLARRYHVPFVLGGCFSRSDRGVQISMRLIEAASGTACWADWFDDPTDISRDHVEHAARRLASRVADRLQQCPMATSRRPMGPAAGQPGGQAVGTASVARPSGHEPHQADHILRPQPAHEPQQPYRSAGGEPQRSAG